MKKLLILLLVLTAVSQAPGQKAADILSAVSRKYASFASYSAGFRVSGAEKYTGTLLAKGKMYKISYGGQEVYNNGKEVYTYIAETNEVNITTYNEGDESDISPNAIFNLYKKGYASSYKNEVTLGGKKYDVVVLTPKTRSSIAKIELTIGKADKLISSWTVYDKSGATTYAITGFKPDITIADSAFTFDKSKYPKVEVVDLR
ncbi:outer membrane lipoprotein carrier protein LolA [Leadbetterella sp. DM7]|uniref:LolA family protein n=1 Tax=Leadbetterella sp. DM7 TaxID=3235085 RepID=UPI00349E761B